MLIICSSQVFPKCVPSISQLFVEQKKKKLAVPHLVLISYSIKRNLEAEDQPSGYMHTQSLFFSFH